ncbi:MAG TPA: hypothetical protein VM487_14050 [Phycisphaerae bacterium]|nr:hypothetical protein [Phycisphaerae bacterium]
MSLLKAIIRGTEVAAIAGERGHKKARIGFAAGMRKALVAVEHHHKNEEFITKAGGLGGGLTGKGAQAPDAYYLTSRHRTLLRSYKFPPVSLKDLTGRYGSDLIYAPVHEFGSTKNNIHARPTLQRTIDAMAETVERLLAESTGKALDA